MPPQPPLPLHLAEMSEALAREICTWRYEPPWHIYDMGPWDMVLARSWTLGVPAARDREMLAVMDPGGALVAYLRLSHTHQRWMLGVGLHPERCGQGLGPSCVELGWAEHQRRCPGEPLWLEVRSWNQRAVRCYAAAGFDEKGTTERTTPIGSGTFVVMRREG